MIKLEYFAYNENGSGNIEKYNVLNDGFVDRYLKPLKKAYKADVKAGKKECLLKQSLSEELRKTIFYQYWGRAEYEVVVTTWPPFVEKSEVDRLSLLAKNIKYRENVNLCYGKKISIYDQVMINFNVFFCYVFENYFLK